MDSSFGFPLFPASTVRFAHSDDFLHMRARSLHHRAAAISRFPRAVPTRPTWPEAFAMVELACQAVREERFEQAQSLIDAAYAAYDQCDWGS